MKSLRYWLLSTLFLTFFSFGFAQVQQVPCNGEQINGKSCDICFQGRFYMNSVFDVWDRYFPEGVGKAIGTSSSRSIYNLDNNYIIHEGTPTRDDTKPISNYAPGDKNYVYSFVNKNFRIIGHPANYNDRVGSILYNIFVRNEDNNGSSITTNWSYTDGTETVVNNRVSLHTSAVNLGNSTKKFSSQVLEHNECMGLYVSWCGDSILDTQYGEVCDYNDTTHQGWGAGGCDTSCQPITVTPTSSGPTSSGPTSSGPTSSGPTSSGPTSSGPTGSGPSGSGPSGSGPSGSGPSGSGPSGSGPTPGGGQFADTPSCNYVDPPSIQIGEYLPLWWKLKSGIWANSCNVANIGKYNSSNATCSFQISNGIGESYNFDNNCFLNDWSNLANGYLQSMGISPSFDGRTNILISPATFSGLGEYVIRLNKVKYQLCDGVNWVPGEYNGTVCEMNFAVTRPYLLQRGTNISTVNNDVLNNFYQLNGSRIVPKNQLQNITISSYSGGTDILYILSGFITKYDNLAVKTTNLSELGLLNLKKVPDRNIYIIDAGGGTLTLSPNASFSEPLTLIIKNGNLRVKDNLVGYGMYIVPNGNVFFDSSNCDTRQIVHGIFIAQNFNTNIFINNNLSNFNWCKDGRLNIKGMLKGNQIDNLWQNRRSTLLDFFNIAGPDDRKNKVFEGASLLLQTNTDIWINLPPGANELIDKLQIKNN